MFLIRDSSNEEIGIISIKIETRRIKVVTKTIRFAALTCICSMILSLGCKQQGTGPSSGKSWGKTQRELRQAVVGKRPVGVAGLPGLRADIDGATAGDEQSLSADGGRGDHTLVRAIFRVSRRVGKTSGTLVCCICRRTNSVTSE